MSDRLHSLKRYPPTPRENLQAWDSADVLLLKHCKALPVSEQRVLIVNDNFGALTCSLSGETVESYSDSYLAHQATALNSNGACTMLSSLDQLSGFYGLVLLRIPKTMSFLEDILAQLTQCLNPGAQVVCGAMVKHLAPASFDSLQKYIGETTTSLAEKKARLVFARFEKEPVPSLYPRSLALDGFLHPFRNPSNLFSREKLDRGTQFLLEHLPVGEFTQILDLGCGNGIVGIAAQQRNPTASLVFCDESWQALESARANYQHYFPQGSARFVWTNCYEEQAPESLDLVLCNPPFHQAHALGDTIAWQMFVDAHRALKPGGLLRIVGNAHLGYHHKLKRLFGKSRIVATNERFMIVDAHVAP